MRPDQLISEAAEAVAAQVERLRSVTGASEDEVRRSLEASKTPGTAGPGDPALATPQHLREARERTDTRTTEPPTSHRALVGPMLVLAKKAFRVGFQPFINELLRAQVQFNERIVDAVTLLQEQVERQAKQDRRFQAEVMRRLEALEQRKDEGARPRAR